MKTKIILDLISSISVPKTDSEMFKKYADKIFIGKKAYFWTDGIMAIKIYYSQWIKKPEVNLSTDAEHYIEYYIEKKDFKEIKDTENIKPEMVKEFKLNMTGKLEEWFRENKKKIVIEDTDFRLNPVKQNIVVKQGEREIILDFERFSKIITKIMPVTMFYNETKDFPVSFNSFDMYQKKDMRRLHCQMLLMPLRS